MSKQPKRSRYEVWVSVEVRASDYMGESIKTREVCSFHENAIDPTVIKYLADKASEYVPRAMENRERRVATMLKIGAPSSIVRHERALVRRWRIRQEVLKRWQAYRRKYTLWHGWEKQDRISLQSVTDILKDHQSMPVYLCSCVKTKRVLMRIGEDLIYKYSQREWRLKTIA